MVKRSGLVWPVEIPVKTGEKMANFFRKTEQMIKTFTKPVEKYE